MPCIKHNYREVNNRYKNGKPVISGGEWVTETKCKDCGLVLEIPEYLSVINKDMKYKDLEKYYLCGIGSHGKINDFGVGIYNEDRESFSFSNGSYSPMELYKKAVGSSETYVISATPLQEIDDKELLYKYQNNVYPPRDNINK